MSVHKRNLNERAKICQGQMAAGWCLSDAIANIEFSLCSFLRCCHCADGRGENIRLNSAVDRQAESSRARCHEHDQDAHKNRPKLDVWQSVLDQTTAKIPLV
jgi:hypothetical protein